MITVIALPFNVRTMTTLAEIVSVTYLTVDVTVNVTFSIDKAPVNTPVDVQLTFDPPLNLLDFYDHNRKLNSS